MPRLTSRVQYNTYSDGLVNQDLSPFDTGGQVCLITTLIRIS